MLEDGRNLLAGLVDERTRNARSIDLEARPTEKLDESFDGKGLPATGWTVKDDSRGKADSQCCVALPILDDVDNVFIERLWRSVKYEDIYLKSYESGADCYKGLTSYFKFYSHERPHQSLDFRTPWEVHNSHS